jgi:hypothetical protein
MCSDQSRLFLTSSKLNMQCIFWFSKVM